MCTDSNAELHKKNMLFILYMALSIKLYTSGKTINKERANVGNWRTSVQTRCVCV